MTSLPTRSGTDVVYPIEQTRLSNGLRVQVNTDPVAPGAAVNLWYRVGSGDEQARGTGFAHLFEHLMFQGSAHVAPSEHLGLVESVGGTANATTSFDRTNYFETVPVHALELALWLEADRLASLDVSQANLDTQREVVKEEKRQRYDNVPYGGMLAELLELNFPGDHPNGHATIGSMADLDAATLDDVRSFHSRWYRPDGAVLTICGPLVADEAFSLAEKYFGKITPGQEPVPAAAHPDPLPRHVGVPTKVVHADVPRDVLALTWRTPETTDPTSNAVGLAMDVLTGSQSSRLHQRLVRELELAEGVGAGDYALARGTSLGIFQARAREGVSVETIRDHILTAIEELASDGPTDAELLRVKAAYQREWFTELSMIDQRADQLGQYATLFGDPERMNTAMDEVLATDAEAVAAAARDWLAPATRAELHYLVQEKN